MPEVISPGGTATGILGGIFRFLGGGGTGPRGPLTGSGHPRPGLNPDPGSSFPKRYKPPPEPKSSPVPASLLPGPWYEPTPTGKRPRQSKPQKNPKRRARWQWELEWWWEGLDPYYQKGILDGIEAAANPYFRANRTLSTKAPSYEEARRTAQRAVRKIGSPPSAQRGAVALAGLSPSSAPRSRAPVRRGAAAAAPSRQVRPGGPGATRAKSPPVLVSPPAQIGGTPMDVRVPETITAPVQVAAPGVAVSPGSASSVAVATEPGTRVNPAVEVHPGPGPATAAPSPARNTAVAPGVAASAAKTARSALARAAAAARVVSPSALLANAFRQSVRGPAVVSQASRAVGPIPATPGGSLQPIRGVSYAVNPSAAAQPALNPAKCRCPSKKKKGEKAQRKPRAECWKGTYVETAFGLTKRKRERVPC